MHPALAELGGYPLAAFQDLAREMADSGPVYDFSVGDPVEPTPEFIRSALIEAVPEVSQYPTAAGLPELRAAIAGWVARRTGVSVDPDDHVLPTAGSKEAIFHFPLAVVDPAGPRRHVLYGTPGYAPYERGARFSGAAVDPVTLTPESGWRLDLAGLDRGRLGRASLAWLNYPHNPTGAVTDHHDLARQLAAAREAELVLGSDECYLDIHPVGADPPPSLLEAAAASSSAADPDLSGLMVAFSLSKRSGMTGYRCGALVGDPELIARNRKLRPNIGTASPEFVQHAAIAAWSDDDHAAARREIFDAKRAVVLEFCARAGLEVSGSDATFYVWVRAPGGDDAAYAEALLRRRIIVSPGRAFGPGGQGWLRLALVPDRDGCEQACAIWEDAIGVGAVPGHA